MELRYTAEEDVMLDTPSKALSEGEQQQLRADLNAQGMDSLSELSWLYRGSALPLGKCGGGMLGYQAS